MNQFNPTQYKKLRESVHNELMNSLKDATDWFDRKWIEEYFDTVDRDEDELIKLVFRNQAISMRYQMREKIKYIPIPKIGVLYIKQGKLHIEE